MGIAVLVTRALRHAPCDTRDRDAQVGEEPRGRAGRKSARGRGDTQPAGEPRPRPGSLCGDSEPRQMPPVGSGTRPDLFLPRSVAREMPTFSTRDLGVPGRLQVSPGASCTRRRRVLARLARRPPGPRGRAGPRTLLRATVPLRNTTSEKRRFSSTDGPQPADLSSSRRRFGTVR